MQSVKWLLVFIFSTFIFHASCSYYYNGTHTTKNPISNLLWFNNSIITYLSSESIYSTESLYEDSNLPLYYSPTQPKSQNVFFYYTTHLTQTEGMADQYEVAFFRRDNLPDCQADITQNNYGEAQRVLVTSSSVYVLQKSMKIHINKVSSPGHKSQKTAKCKQTQFNPTTLENLSFDDKKLTYLQKSKQLAISYHNHIVILSEQNNQFTAFQSIKLPQTLNMSRYEMKYTWTQQQETIVVGRQTQILVYVKGTHQNEYGLGLTVKLQSVYVAMELLGIGHVLVLTSDCKVIKISLIDSQQPHQQIASFPDKCNTSLLTPLLGIRQNNDLIFVTVQKIAQLTKQQQVNQQHQAITESQLQIYLQSLSDQSKAQTIYKIPLQHKDRSFHLQDFKFIKQTDFLYLITKEKESQKTRKNPVQETVFMGFQVFLLIQNRKSELQWQWRSREYVSAEIQDYSICQDGVVVLESKNGQQNLTWYKTVVSYVDWPYPVQLVSQISSVTVLQIVPVTLYRSFNFEQWQGLYFIYPPTKPITISPNGWYVASLLNDKKALQILTSEMSGAIDLKNYSSNSSLIQFINNNTIIQFNKYKNCSVELYFYQFEFKSKTEFSYVLSEAQIIDGLSVEDLEWNLENVIFLNEKKDNFTVLKLEKDKFVRDEEVNLEQNITKTGLKLKLSTDKNIFLYQPGSQTLYQYVWCKSHEYLRQGQCAQRSIGPDPSPFPSVQIVLAVIGIVAIFIVVYFAIRWQRSRSRLYRLENSLLQSVTGQQEDSLDIDRE